MKRRYYFFILLIMSISFPFSAFAQTTESEEPYPEHVVSSKLLDQYISFKKLFPNSRFVFDESGEQVREMDSFLSEKYSGNPETMAIEFLKENHLLLGLKANLSDLKHVSTSEYDIKEKVGIQYIQFQQLFNNVPIQSAEVMVQMTKTGRIFRVYNNYIKNLSVDNKVVIDEQEAEKVALNDVEKIIGNQEYEKKITLQIEHLKGRNLYVYQVLLGIWEFVIDAQDSTILSKRKIIIYATGLGDVFIQNMCKTPNIESRDLVNLNGDGYLKGYNFEIRTFSGERAFSSNLQFSFGSNNPKFDQVEIYFQLERARDYLHSIGFPLLADRIAVSRQSDLLGDSLICNACYLPSSTRLFFGPPLQDGCSGISCLSPGQDGDIIFHEYFHAVLDFTNNNLASSSEHMAQSINEALADYYAASFFNDSCLSEHIEACGGCMRNLNNQKTYFYDKDFDDPHKMGLILSGALWDNRELIGQSLADEFAHIAVLGLSSKPNFSQYAVNYIDAAIARLDDIENWFEQLIWVIAVEGIRENFCSHGINLPDSYSGGCPRIVWWEEKNFQGTQHTRVLFNSDEGQCLRLVHNDAMKSIKFYGKSGWHRLNIYDSGNCSTNDDWGEILYSTDSQPTSVPKIGRAGTDTVTPPGHYIFHYNNGLPGKVSAFKLE